MRKSCPVILLILVFGVAVPAFSQSGAKPLTVREVTSLVDRGLVDSAYTLTTAALKSDSTNLGLLTVLAELQKSKGQLKARRTTLDKIIAINRRAVDARVAIAEELLISGKVDSAKFYARAAAISSNSRSPEAFYWLGRAYHQAGRLDSALIYYRAAWTLVPAPYLY